MPIAWNEYSAKSNGGTERVARLLESHLGDRFDDFWIVPSRLRNLDNTKYRVFWDHDGWNDPESKFLSDENIRNQFHKFVFCSNYQKTTVHMGLGFPHDHRSTVIETPVYPVERAVKRVDEVRLCYLSTPNRGLEILLPVFAELAKKYDNIYLDVFSSFKIYGWDEPEHFENLFKQYSTHPRIRLHGAKPNAEVRNCLKHAHILAYPSIWIESCSQSLIEAMSAGLLCVHSDIGGLPDTAGGMTQQYSFTPDPNQHAQIFYRELERAIQIVNFQETQNRLSFVKSYADTRFHADSILNQWENLLEDIREQYQGQGLIIPNDQVKEFKL